MAADNSSKMIRTYIAVISAFSPIIAQSHVLLTTLHQSNYFCFYRSVQRSIRVNLNLWMHACIHKFRFTLMLRCTER